MAEYGYDAWNRLVKVVDAGTSSTVAEYGYDGRNFRIVTKTYASGVLSEVRHAYYSGDWQLLEERVEAAPLPNPQSLIPAAQFIWGLRYIDDLVLRDRNADSNTSTGDLGKTGSGLEERLYAMQDANWTVVAIANASGAVQERYLYSAYGTPKFLDAAFNTRSTSSYAWETLYTGRQYDPETGFLYYRQRYLTAPLGRFLSRDPIGHKGGINLYAYVGDSPARDTDPTGLDRYITHWGSSISAIHAGAAVDTWRCENGEWVKTGTMTFDFHPTSAWSILGLGFWWGQVTPSHGLNLENPIRFPSTPCEDQVMLKWCQEQVKNPPAFRSAFYNCMFWAVGAVNVGMGTKCECCDFERKLPAPGWNDSPLSPKE